MSAPSTVFVIDDDPAIRELVEFQLLAAGYLVRTYASAHDFLKSDFKPCSGCVLTDVRMPDMDGLELQEELNRRGIGLPVVIMTAIGNVPIAVRAMRAGAVDIVEKPFSPGILRKRIEQALSANAAPSRNQFEKLTSREKIVLEQIVAGKPSKAIAEELSISQRTVEVHRAKIMEKLDVDNVASLVRLTLSSQK
jgi:two-component system response regulator FixJ